MISQLPPERRISKLFFSQDRADVWTVEDCLFGSCSLCEDGVFFLGCFQILAFMPLKFRKLRSEVLWTWTMTKTIDKMVTACFQTSIDYGSFILALVQHMRQSQWTCPVDRTGTRSSHGWRRPANQGPMEVACRTVSQPRYQHPAECLMEQMLNKNRQKTSRESGNIKSKVTCILKIRKRAPH